MISYPITKRGSVHIQKGCRKPDLTGEVYALPDGSRLDINDLLQRAEQNLQRGTHYVRVPQGHLPRRIE